MCPILRGKMGLDTPPALGGAGVRDGRGGRSPPTRGGSRGLGRGACRGGYWGLRPLAPWGGLSCGLAALYFGTHDVWLLFPLRDLPARSAGRRRGSLVVAEARPSAQLAIPGHNPLASCRRSRLRGGGGLYLLPKECRLSAPLRPPFGGHLPLKGEARGLASSQRRERKRSQAAIRRQWAVPRSTERLPTAGRTAHLPPGAAWSLGKTKEMGWHVGLAGASIPASPCKQHRGG